MRFAIAAMLVFHAAPVLAWNALGHKVVAEIAWRELDPATRQSIVDTLRRHPRFGLDFTEKMTEDVLRADKATQDRWVFQHAATWPDIARGLPDGERVIYDRPTWHYVNFPVFVDESDRVALAGKLTVNVATDRPATMPERDYNVVQAIGYCRWVIQSESSPTSKALAYSWLFHLVGDLHQPLHAVSLYSVHQFPAGDRGGNSIPLRRGRNLHSLWDGLLGRRDLMRDVDREVAQLSDRQHYGNLWDIAANETDPSKWADESRDLSVSFVYSEGILDAVRQPAPGMELTPIELPEEYMKQAGDHARRRIITAGIRLAVLLKKSQGGQTTGATRRDASVSSLTNRAHFAFRVNELQFTITAVEEAEGAKCFENGKRIAHWFTVCTVRLYPIIRATSMARRRSTSA